jgi:hypothetical protein
MGTAGLLIVAAIALLRSFQQSRAAARAEASFNPDVALTPGEVVLLGTVERAPEAEVAVRVEIEQDGAEQESSGTWSYKWTETTRKVQVHPFYLLHSSGARIRVEPGDNVMLVDEMDGVLRVDLTKRVRVAELLPGEKVFAVGELRRAPDPTAPLQGYRGRAEGYLLVPPRGGKMLLSSEPLGQRFSRRAQFHWGWAGVLVFAAVAFNLIFSSFHTRRIWGETVDARVTELSRSIDSDGHHQCKVTVWGANDLTFTGEVSCEDFSRINKGDTIKVRNVPRASSEATFGSESTVHEAAFVAVLLFPGLALGYFLRARSTRPWYERDLVETGSGRLADCTPTEHGVWKHISGRNAS